MSLMLFGKKIKDLSFDEFISLLLFDRPKSIEVVVTPNLYHFYLASKNAKLNDVYFVSEHVVCDSRVLQIIKKVKGHDVPLIPGSNLVSKLFQKEEFKGKRALIVGGIPEDIEQIKRKYSGCDFYQLIPSMGFVRDKGEFNDIARNIQDIIVGKKLHYVFFALGTPQQELLAHHVKSELKGFSIGCYFLCIGASFDFLLGRKPRAPKWMQTLGMEWLFRLISEPKRLFLRYFNCAIFLVKNIRNV